MEKQIINRFDTKKLETLRNEINEVLEPIREKYNLSIGVTGCKYEPEGTAKFDLITAIIADNGIVMTTEANNYIAYKDDYKIKPELGEIFIDNKQRKMQIIGLKPNTKMPVLYQDMKSLKKFKSTVQYVNQFFL